MKAMHWLAAATALFLLGSCGGGDPGRADDAARKTGHVTGTEAAVPRGLAEMLKAATPIAGNVVVNGGFESGGTGWRESSTAAQPLIGTFTGSPANTGSRMAWLGGVNRSVDKISQTITVPSSAESARLQFWYRITSSDSEITDYDFLAVEVYSTGGTHRATLVELSNLDRTNGWVQSRAFDLSAYKGQTLELRFTADLDISEVTTFMIDDVSVYPEGAASVPSPAPSPAPTITRPDDGLWWNPDEPGRGFFMEQQGEQMFVGAYMYEEGGHATWYSALLAPGTDGSYTGPILRFSGGQTLDGSYRAPDGVREEGRMTLRANRLGTAQLDVTQTPILGTRTIPVRRFTVGDTVLPSGATFQNGVWWSESESGRGYVIQVQGNTVLMGSFMYTTFGHPVWYLGTGTLTSPGSFTVQLQQMTGGQSLTGDYKVPTVSSNNVGRMTFVANSPTTATLTLPNGRQISLKRFAPASTAPPPAPTPTPTPTPSPSPSPSPTPGPAPAPAPSYPVASHCLVLSRASDNYIRLTNTCSEAVRYAFCLQGVPTSNAFSCDRRPRSIFGVMDYGQGAGTILAGRRTELGASGNASGAIWYACHDPSGTASPLLTELSPPGGTCR